jgi:hypothetical protein
MAIVERHEQLQKDVAGGEPDLGARQADAALEAFGLDHLEINPRHRRLGRPGRGRRFLILECDLGGGAPGRNKARAHRSDRAGIIGHEGISFARECRKRAKRATFD